MVTLLDDPHTEKLRLNRKKDKRRKSGVGRPLRHLGHSDWLAAGPKSAAVDYVSGLHELGSFVTEPPYCLAGSGKYRT